MDADDDFSGFTSEKSKLKFFFCSASLMINYLGKAGAVI